MKILSAAVFTFCSAFTATAAQVTDKATSIGEIVAAGGIIIYPLAALSILALMLVLILFFTMRSGAVASTRYMQAAEALIRKRDFLGLLALSSRHNEAVASVMERAMNFISQSKVASISEAREVAQAEGARIASLWNQRISYLADMGAIAPMLGLLGTVLGMIKCFTAVANEANANLPMLLANGVAEALITTAAGIGIGIPVMAAYAFFRGRVQGMISSLEASSTILMAQLGSVRAESEGL